MLDKTRTNADFQGMDVTSFFMVSSRDKKGSLLTYLHSRPREWLEPQRQLPVMGQWRRIL
jgi:hypothetical protein